ncbi:MAG: hypothetical protein FRX48_01350 [Lasallia pustulata]|uniref:Uncharacterized protein n=1 Tax=Lasallia pustulata TaxID=136370 RepID=A0A1W5CUZ2_9LECA|nr:MAG: hypothetical protein FRX48_01350 [Lasallia pustulata]SLM34667.1 hypothetical protein LPUS_03537 [Lasallia pustulata]
MTARGQSEAYPGHKRPKKQYLRIAAVALFITLGFLIFSSSLVPSAAQLSNSAKDAARHVHRPKIPKLGVPNIQNPFRQAAHKPPKQANSTSGEAEWFSDWKWLNPFSSTITLDENWTVLPPLRTRPLIYTYYDTAKEIDAATTEAENELLLIWRRAWWAQGFRPVILGKAEAMDNPLYESLQAKQLSPELESDLLRWLAWGRMGTGILANWLVLPMGPYEDNLLSYLRRGSYPKLTRYESFNSGLFSGDIGAINSVLAQTIKAPALEKSKSFLEAADPAIFTVDPVPIAIAFYNSATITGQYQHVADKLLKSHAIGFGSLAELITSHLHTTFQNDFPSGIAVLKPLPLHSTALISPALSLANSLTRCSKSPIPSSCPPNRPKCQPCSKDKPMLVTTPSVFRNTSDLYTIGTIPHPYTLATLLAQNSDITTRQIRRDTIRDPWLLAVTKELLGNDVSGPARIVKFKESVASGWSESRGLWFTAERNLTTSNLDWHFGFPLPHGDKDEPPHEIPVPNPPASEAHISLPNQQELGNEQKRLKVARELLARKGAKVGIREVLEAWNMADTEAWRFVRAYAARDRVERQKWEEDERGFAGTEKRRGEGWSRWFD